MGAGSIFENAVTSIRVGVEDFKLGTAQRNISAVRNFYAGIILLAKEVLIRHAPKADPELVLSAKVKLVPDGTGGVKAEKTGKQTLDYQQISDRFSDFGIKIDVTALKHLQAIRNDIEHHSSNRPQNAIRDAISQGFPVVSALFRNMQEAPATWLGKTWQDMLEIKAVYDKELAAAHATLSKMEWVSPTMHHAVLRCNHCQSKLVAQLDSTNSDQRALLLECRSCGEELDTADVIEQALEEVFGVDAFLRARDGGEPGPIFDCPSCERACLIEGEDCCANCAERLDYEPTCVRCGSGIPIQDALDGLDSGLCSYCNHITEKAMRDN
jgi:hypothetical protein